MPAIKPRLRDDLAVVELDGEAIIYDDADGSLHHLNQTATVVLSMCDGKSTIKELAAEIAEAFSMDAAEVEKQIRALLRDFRKKGLLQEKATSRF
jgi:PqqD family protein of HPr-rel-A system